MSYKLLLISLVFLSLSLGCRDNGQTNYKLSGTITFKGKPVPSGEIFLRPVGNGPGGFGFIKDGKYKTIDGKGYQSGLSEITFHGYSKSSKVGAGGGELFRPCKVEVDLPAEDFTYDLEVTEQDR